MPEKTPPDEITSDLVLAQFNSLPSSTSAAMRIARRWQHVPDTTTDEQALTQGLITPEMLVLVMQIVQSLMANCMSNTPARAWQRLRGYIDATKELDRIGDTVRLNGVIDKWMARLGYPRESGDIVEVRKALILEGAGSKQEEFNQVQVEMLWVIT
jgi:hypothetical protein